MASPWPATLPAPQSDPASYKPQNNTIRTEMAAGVAKMRRRYTAVAEDTMFSLKLTQAQVTILDSFVRVTLKDVLPFEWQDFRVAAGPVRQYRFKSRPVFTKDVGVDYWQADLDLEMLP